MSFAASLSGLAGASKAIDIIGNNIANSQTIGFKTSKLRFADVLASSLPGTQPNISANAGVGTDIINQQFVQGGMARSDNPLAMAISGQGFFRLNNSGDISYSRDGQFQLAADATNPDKRVLVNSTGFNVTGYLAEFTADPQGVIATGAGPQNISIDTVMPAAATSAVSVSANLDARVAPAPAAFDPANPLSYNHTTAITVYDSAGIGHDLRVYFSKPGPGNSWDLYSTLDSASQTGPVNLSFDVNGLLTTATPLPAQTYALSGGASLTVATDFTGTVQYGKTFNVDSISQNGYPDGAMDGANSVSVGLDGVIQAFYSNGQSRKVAQVVLANFVNPNALISQGDGQWKENPDPVRGTGKVVLDTPGGSLGVGLVQGGVTELSNVDLSAELVGLIEQQRNYQASAQTFKILDQALQTLVNVR